YDRARPLVIDPELIYSTFLGGSSAEGEYTTGNGIAVDGAGNAYITGLTRTATFPGVTGSSIQPTHGRDTVAFVTKINAAGTAIVYSTFLGGDGASGQAIAVDGAGNAYVTGNAGSTAFPGAGGRAIRPANAGDSIFVTKIDAAGTAIVYSTFLGGGLENRSNGIAVDGAGNAYVTGGTSGTAFSGVTGSSIQPANAGGRQDAFVTKIDAAGTAIVYSTFLGGSELDVGNGIAVDGAGNAYVTGMTFSTTFPGITGSSIQPANGGINGDAFVTKINAAGTAIVYSTFLGGSGEVAVTFGQGIAVDGAGNAYVTGMTSGTGFSGVTGSSIQPAQAGLYDAFATKINAAGTAIVYSTYLGGGGKDWGQGIAVDSRGNAYVTGSTSPYIFPQITSGRDAFVKEINAAGTAIVYSTLLGGGGEDVGNGIAVDRAGNAYVTGTTSSTTFTGVTGGSIQPALGGTSDAFITKLSPRAVTVAIPTLSSGGLILTALLLAGLGIVGVRRASRRA
ncbi:MAG: SBBP repeat-containing protein, partial [Acidobacteriota bacterium]|nr:SBBP repeat-containing protein [Acidobacteriota bacterium]